MSEFSFNLSQDGQKKSFEQSKQDLVFQKGKALKKSKVMSSPMFINTIAQYGADGAKTIILQELVNMSEAEIEEEVAILSKIAEDNNDIKRSLRAAKFLAIQWIEDERRQQSVKNKCEFIVEVIPTFKNSPERKKFLPQIPKQEDLLSLKDDIVEEDTTSENTKKPELIFPEIKNRPEPLENPPVAVVTKSTTLNKLLPKEKILVITDVQGDYVRLRDALLKYKVIKLENNIFRYNQESKTKVLIVGDLFNKSPYSSWGGQAVYQSFQVFELVRRLVTESNNNIFISLSTYDVKVCSGQIFKDSLYGFCSKVLGVKVQAQAIPVMVSFLENTAFDKEDSLYSIWKKDTSSGELFFTLKDEFKIGNRPELKIRATEMYLPDISSIRGLFQNIYLLLTQVKEKRPKNIHELEEKIKTLIKPKAGEGINCLLDSKNRSHLFEGILRGTKTIDFLRKSISSVHKFQTEKRETLTFNHVSLQNEYAGFFEKTKEAGWPPFDFEKFLTESKFLKMRKIDPKRFFNDLKKVGFNTLQEFITTPSEEIFENLTAKNLLDTFVPYISPNKLKFGYVKSFELIQNTLKQEDKTGLLGFRLVDRNLDNFDDIVMKKVSELDKSSKEMYTEKFLTDIFGSNKGFTIKHTEDKKIVCQKLGWNIELEIDKNSALFEDEHKSIQVPIKHIAFISYN